MRRLHLALVVVASVVGCSAGGAGDDPGVRKGDSGPDDGGFHLDDGGFVGLPDGASPDPTKDNDGDGYLFVDDCDDTNPLINPGAYDVAGDHVDNDCDGVKDSVDACQGGLVLTSTTALDFAKALDLCRTTVSGATGKEKRWGVISASLETTDGVGKPLPYQYGLQQTWGVLKPREGGVMAALSTGSARTPGQPQYIKPLALSAGATGTGNENVAPPGWPQNTTGCPNPTAGKRGKALDPVVLRLKLRVPTNAKSFTYDFDFYTSEYIDYVCTEFNDTFIALLKTKAPLDPKNNGNISFDKTGSPVNVNSGFFEVCEPGKAAHPPATGKTFTCALGRAELSGTGYEGDGPQDGATSWLRTKATVVPGEEMEIAFMIWNTSDHQLQSAVLLDNWQWGADPTTGGPETDRPK